MLKKLLITLTALTALGLLLTGCQSPASQTKPEKIYKTTNEFAKAVKKANKKLKSIHMNTNSEIYNKKESSPYQTVTIIADTIYKDQKINRLNTSIESKTEGVQTEYQEFIMPNDGELYTKEVKTGEYEKNKVSKGDFNNIELDPNYFELLDYFYDNSDALTLKEKRDDYLVTIKDEDLSLIQTFGKEYGIWIEGFSEDNSDKQLIIRFDKKTLFMKELQITIIYDEGPNYSKVHNHTKYSQWNKITKKDIKAP